MEQIRKYIKPLLGVILSTAIIGLGVCLYVYADLGGDSITVLEDGMSRVLGIRQIGRAHV